LDNSQFPENFHPDLQDSTILNGGIDAPPQENQKNHSNTGMRNNASMASPPLSTLYILALLTKSAPIVSAARHTLSGLSDAPRVGCKALFPDSIDLAHFSAISPATVHGRMDNHPIDIS